MVSIFDQQMVFSKRFRKTVRNIPTYVPLTDISIRKMSGVRKVTVFYLFTTSYGPYCLIWAGILKSTLSISNKCHTNQMRKSCICRFFSTDILLMNMFSEE